LYYKTRCSKLGGNSKNFQSDGSKQIQFKGVNSPASKADLLANELITARLANLTLEIDFISEESYRPNTDIHQTPFRSLNPLHETKEF
jgi:3'-phosphoadenosine 5'-phosphosulfate (PAPS) 3'-phosphatase